MSSIVLWTKLEPTTAEGPVLVVWELLRSFDGAVLRSGTAACARENDYTVKVLVEGLQPSAEYVYRFRRGSITSPTGRFRTLPSAGRLRFAVVSCAKFNAGYFNAYDRVAERPELHFVLHLGDAIYEAANRPPSSQTPGRDIGRDFEPDHECRTLGDYRMRYRQYHRDPSVQKMRASHALVATLDDHELADNAWSGGAQEHDPVAHGPWADRRDAALQAWEEWTPTLRSARFDALSVELNIPGLIQLLLIECRTNRSHAATATDDRTQLGAHQRSWLLDRVTRGDEPWLVLGSPSVFSPLYQHELAQPTVTALRKLKLIGLDRDEPWFDGWDWFAAERQLVLDAVAAAGRQLLVLSGDSHASFEFRHEASGVFGYDEAAGPSVTSQNLDDKMDWPSRTQSIPLEAQAVIDIPGLRWCDFDSHGYLTVDVRPDVLRVTWMAVDEVIRRCTTEHVARTLTIDRDPPRTGDA